MTGSKKSKANRQNDKKSIEEIYSQTWETLYRYVYFRVQNRQEAEDITQEAYVKVLSKWGQKTSRPDHPMEYLKATALNIIRDRWRKTKRKGAEINLEAVKSPETAVESPAEAATLRVMIEDALKRLSEDQRRVIELRIIKGFSVSRTADMMDKKESTVRVIQYRALQALADILETKDLVKEGRDNG
jgi:RNA polymerase sigma-70 factor (ECF subfamily)